MYVEKVWRLMSCGCDGTVGNDRPSKSKHGNTKYLLSAIIPMERCSVEIIEDPNSLEITAGSRFENLLLVARDDGKLEWGLSRFMIICSTPKEQEVWYNALQGCINECCAQL